jgi:succinoglycan biosynthesis protein ExoW
LRRALTSIALQDVPEGWLIRVIVVDDESPADIANEIAGMNFTFPSSLTIIRQSNTGVSGARNAGLDLATKDSDAIAFLDSDDAWAPGHLTKAISALKEGYDFYFSDNSRINAHSSHIDDCRETKAFIASQPTSMNMVSIPPDLMIGFCITEFPSQASTVVYRASVAKHLRFEGNLRHSGEDVIFFAELASRAKHIGFSREDIVYCGEGINIFFGNLNWDSKLFLGIKVDQLLTHRLLKATDLLSKANSDINTQRLKRFVAELNFHLYRNALKNPLRAARALLRLVRNDPGAAVKVLLRAPVLKHAA